jgi:hypothetical protein
MPRRGGPRTLTDEQVAAVVTSTRVTMSVRLQLSAGDHSAKEVGVMFVAGSGTSPSRCALDPGLPRDLCEVGRVRQSGRSARALPMAPSPSSTNELKEEDHYGLPESVRNERKR